jgi:predicted nucleotidyltransferase
VILYGSRAKGAYRDGSDLDLTVIGDTVMQSDILKIADELDDLLLPYKIDLSLMRQIEDKALIEHIKRVGVVFYEKASCAQSRFE